MTVTCDSTSVASDAYPPSRRSRADSQPAAIHEERSVADQVAVLQAPDTAENARSKAEAARWLFRHVCNNNDNKSREALRSCGVVDALQHVLATSADYASQLYAVASLDVLLDEGDKRTRARPARISDPTSADYARLFTAIDVAGTTEERVVALETLFCFATIRPCASDLAEFVPRVVYQLRNHRTPVGAAAALVVIPLAEDHTALLIDHGAVSLVVDLLVKGGHQHKKRALDALSALLKVESHAEIVAAKITETNAIASLVELVRSGVGDLRARAALTVAQLAAEGAVYQSAVGDAGVVPPLLALARDGEADEKSNAILAICAVGAHHDANWQRLAASGVGSVLVDLLQSPSYTHRSGAAEAIVGFARGSRASQLVFVEAGVFEPLLELMRSGTEDDKEAAATAVAELVASHERIKAVAVEAGVIPVLLEAMCDGPCKAAATKALGSLARKSALAKLRVVQAGALAPLVVMLREGDDDARREAANAVRYIAKRNESYAVEIALLGALEALVANLAASTTRGDEDGAGAALRALRWLTECPMNQDALLALGVRDVLNDAESLGAASVPLVARVRTNLNLQGANSDGDGCCVM